MSFQDMAWAVEQKCSSAGQKLVLLMLANHSNGHTGQCNPSHKRLAEECSMGISTLKRNISGLEESGFLSVLHKSQDGVSLPNQYKLKSSKLDGVGPNWTDGRPKLDGGVGPNRATKQEVEPGIETLLVKPAKSEDFCPHAALIELYHQTLPTARRIQEWTPARQQALRARWREKPDRQSLEWWAKFFGYVAKSEFLSGRTQAPGRKPFELSLDWLCKSANFVKVLEGAYE